MQSLNLVRVARYCFQKKTIRNLLMSQQIQVIINPIATCDHLKLKKTFVVRCSSYWIVEFTILTKHLLYYLTYSKPMTMLGVISFFHTPKIDKFSK